MQAFSRLHNVFFFFIETTLSLCVYLFEDVNTQTNQLVLLGLRECVTLKPKSLTRHNFFSNKFDTTAWNDFTRDPRDAGWLESRRHDGSRNQMYFMRKARKRPKG